jgi:hypothetical protein
MNHDGGEMDHYQIYNEKLAAHLLNPDTTQEGVVVQAGLLAGLTTEQIAAQINDAKAAKAAKAPGQGGGYRRRGRKSRGRKGRKSRKARKSRKNRRN